MPKGIYKRKEKIPDYLIGKKFGRLEVIRFDRWYIAPSNGNKTPMWLCKCECGEEKVTVANSLKKGLTTSCGCVNSEKVIWRNKLNAYNGDIGAFNVLYRSYRHGAETRYLSFELSKEEFRKLTKEDCYYCGAKPAQIKIGKASIYSDTKDYIYNGIDRVDSDLGYFLDNCVTACFKCNLMKGNIKQIDFIEHLKKIISNVDGKKQK